jgi:hypothetical protein
VGAAYICEPFGGSCLALGIGMYSEFIKWTWFWGRCSTYYLGPVGDGCGGVLPLEGRLGS